jgi:hypothetical protein
MGQDFLIHFDPRKDFSPQQLLELSFEVSIRSVKASTHL